MKRDNPLAALYEWKLSTVNDFTGQSEYIELSEATLRTIIKTLLLREHNKKIGEALLIFYIESKKGASEWITTELERSKRRISLSNSKLEHLNLLQRES